LSVGAYMLVGMKRRVTTGAGGVHGLGCHVVWCPKCRRPVLAGEVGVCCDRLIRDKCAEYDWPVIALEVMPDHIHLFVKADRRHSPSFIASQVKGFTSQQLCGELPALKTRLPTLWSRSFFCATVGVVSSDTVRRFIDTQFERPWRKGN
jgi:putative transposase